MHVFESLGYVNMYAVLFRFIVKNQRCIRYKHKQSHWSVQRKKISPVNKAMQHFNDFYSQVFESEWESIRNGLTNKSKYVAVVNNYGDVDDTIRKLENRGAINVRTLINLEKENIKERNNDFSREKALETIYKMDEEMEKQFQVNEEKHTNKVEKVEHSLASSLKKAEIDETRLIDSQNELSAMLLQEYIPANKIKGKEGWVPESTHYSYYEKSKAPITIEKEYSCHFPEHLNIYSYEYSNHTDFRPPRRDITGVFNYYLMDGGSVLPVLALGLKPDDVLLDMCASPGGKSLLALQTLYPKTVICNDLSHLRMSKIKKVLNEYLYDLDERFFQTAKIVVRHSDARHFEDGQYDCILVDVPCTNDRISLKENENNIFSPSRIKERLQLPLLQSELLQRALKLVKVGGSVVYSTCSLSPIQNDGVVQMSLNKVIEDGHHEYIVMDMTEALKPMKILYKFADQKLLKYGHLVLPYLPLNFGPTYFCKLKRIK